MLDRASEPNWNSSSKSISVMKVSVVEKRKVWNSVVRSIPSENRGSHPPIGFRNTPQDTGWLAFAVISTV